MAKTKPDNLEKYRNIAQYFTMTVAVALGITWIFTSHLSSVSFTRIENTLAVALVIGGVSMGALYAAQLAKKK